MTFKQRFKVAVLFLWLVADYINAVENGAYLKPTDPVFKVGSDITLECRSPENYNTDYPSVKFIVKHEGKQIAEKVADTAVGDYLTIKHTIIDISITDAGVYTCEIVPEGGEKVSVRTNVYVIEDDELTVFGQAGKETKRSCFRPGQYTDLLLDSYWKVNDKTQPEGDLTIENTVVHDAFKAYSCLVTSKKAIYEYGNIDSADKNGAVTEITRRLSVISVSKCKDKNRCALIANVYGNTPVNITWVVNGKRHSPDLIVMENVTSSNTSELNVTRSSSVELIVTGGHSIWQESITLEEDKPSSESNSVNWPVLTIVVVVIVAIVVLILAVLGICYFRKIQKFCGRMFCGAQSANASAQMMVDKTEKGAGMHDSSTAEEKEAKAKEEDAKLLGGTEATTAKDNGST